MLDQESVDSSESTTSTESTTSDKEAVNVTRASSKTDNWHVDTSGTLTCGWATLNASAGYSRSVTESNQQSINRMTETTKKSAQNLKTLHKIQVRGVTETLVTNRMTRVVRNPYPDRTMSVNVFQMLKHFSVSTALTETRLGVILRVDGLDFGADFVLANTDFLRGQLLDSAMIDDLLDATKGAQPPVSTDTLKQAGLIAQRALYHLFENATMFNMPNVAGQDPNSPATSFNASITGNFLDSGLGDALSNHLEYEFATLSFYNQLYRDPAFTAADVNNAISLATTLASEISSKFTTSYPDLTKDPGDSDLRQIMDEHQFTEVFRRVPGFLAMVNGMLVPLLDPVKQEQADLKARQNANFALGRLLQHLKCNQHYYIQQYLGYIYAKTSGQAIIDFANSALAFLDNKSLLPSFLQLADLDVDRTFIDRQRVVVPGLNPLTGRQLSIIGTELFGSGGTVVDPVPTVLDLEVPADGIHLEVAEGACVLANVPPPNILSVGFDVQNAKLTVTQ
jgi:hypothetical protein